MSIEETLDEFIKQNNINREKDLRRSDRNRYENRMLFSWGFALATLSLAVARIDTTSMIFSFIVAGIFVALGFYDFARAQKLK